MNVVYLTDIHDNFAGVSSVLNQTDADLYILSGDLTYHCFGTDEALFRFIELQEKIRNLALQDGASQSDTQATLRYAEKAKDGLTPDVLPAAEGEEYLKLAAEAHQELLRKYQTMHKAIVATQKKCFIIPGNYDIALQGTPVAGYSLHEKAQTVDGINSPVMAARRSSPPAFPKS